MRASFRALASLTLLGAGCIPDVVPTENVTGSGGAATSTSRASSTVSSTHASTGSPSSSSGTGGGSGGAGGAGGTPTSNGGNGGAGGVTTSSTAVSSTAVSSSTGPTCIASGAGGASTCGGGEWAHWNPTVPKNYTLDTDTVTDPSTGLIWQRDAEFNFPLSARDSYCPNLDIGGCSTGWRLPTRIELLSILDYSRELPATDPVAFPNTGGRYWASTPNIATAGTYWTVDFDTGAEGSGDGSGLAKVRCVR